MSIFTRALQKIGINDDEDRGNQQSSSPPQAGKDIDIANPPRAGSKTKTEGLLEFDIDIRLDQDLTDFAEQSKHARFKEAELDFDLAGKANNELSFIETQVLRINPTRTFSNQVDVDLVKLSKAGFITPDDVSSTLSTTFRQLKRPVLNNVQGKGATVLDNANLIMITSSLAGEGKTFSAINMAMSIAMEKDKRVLLIDADVNHPSHHKFFGVEMKNGLTDLLMGRVEDVSDVIYKTNVPSLSLMFSGSRTPHATELFASKAMENFVGELSKRYEDRVIIFDSAPLLLPTEAGVLASHMGQVILIVEAEKTRQELVKQSLEMLSNRIVLMLLNKAHEKNDLGSYGYNAKYEE